jgi:hypothetical protein
MHGFDIGSTIFFKKRSVFGVTLHVANREHKQNFFLFVQNYQTHNQFVKKNLEAQQVWAFKNIKNEPEWVKKEIYYILKVKSQQRKKREFCRYKFTFCTRRYGIGLLVCIKYGLFLELTLKRSIRLDSKWKKLSVKTHD